MLMTSQSSHTTMRPSTNLAASHVAYCELQVQLEATEAQHQLENAEHQASEAMLKVSDAHAKICNLENQELHHGHRQLAEKTRRRMKSKINMEGCIITPLNGAALFAQQDAERQEKQANEDTKQKSKMDAIRSREHEHVLAAGTKVFFANPLASYNHKDDLLDIIAILGLVRASTIAMLTEHIQTYLASHPDVASQPHFSGLMKPHKSCKHAHMDVDIPSQDQAGPSGSI